MATAESAHDVTELPTDTSSRPAHTNWLLALLLLGAGVMVSLQIGKGIAALPELSSDLGISLVTGGWVLAAFNVVGAVVGIVMGATIDRFGYRGSALAGLVLVAASSALGATAQGAGLLLATRFTEGLGFILTALAVPSLILRVTSLRDHGLVFGIWATFVPVGAAIGILVTPLFLSGAGGWRGLWIAAAVLPALWALLLAATTRRLRDTPRSGLRGDAGARVLPVLRSVATSAGPLLLAGVFAAYAFQFLAVFGFLPTLLADDGVSAATAGLLTALAILFNVPGNIVGGFLLGRGVPVWLLVSVASVIMGASAAAIYADGLHLAWRYASVLVLSLAGGLIPAALIGAAPRLAPSPRATATTVGAVMQGSTLGQVAGPPVLAGVAAAVGGWGASPAVLGAAALIALGLGLALRRYA
ncbi:MFS transporter [Streptomyces sp. SYSU K21746]